MVIDKKIFFYKRNEFRIRKNHEFTSRSSFELELCLLCSDLIICELFGSSESSESDLVGECWWGWIILSEFGVKELLVIGFEPGAPDGPAAPG